MATILDPARSGAQTLLQSTARYRAMVNQLLDAELPEPEALSPLAQACRYALCSGGKRFRPILVLILAEAVGGDLEAAGHAAVAIECFHTASLIADDLPCMDDDDERRNRPSTHKVFGEAVALLASYALISKGYGKLAEAARVLPGENRAILALECITRNTGIDGASGGQFLDIFATDHSLETLRTVVEKKTGTLFEVSFVLGWLFGGGDVERLDRVCETAQHYGMAFQIADDFLDVSQDATNGRDFNFVALMGAEQAKAEFLREKAAFKAGLEDLGLAESGLCCLVDLLRI
ncbi:MAG: polyprenyl synthetase family protein [Chlamydiia bacterium]|nr:polyprenyl synthetase family protein [Chlamydiia bacterium]